jgi:hypothetical protein
MILKVLTGTHGCSRGTHEYSRTDLDMLCGRVGPHGFDERADPAPQLQLALHARPSARVGAREYAVNTREPSQAPT